MFKESHLPTSRDDKIIASEVASQQVSIWEKALEYRIHLQRVIDLANKMPINFPEISDVTVQAVSTESINSLQFMVSDLIDASDMRLSNETRPKKRMREILERGNSKSNVNVLTEEIVKIHANRIPFWKSSIEKLHSRVHFGSEQAKSKLKVFNQTMWTHVDTLLLDECKNPKKSRILLDESSRIDKPNSSSLEMIGKECDEEVYDDRQFYSTLLKNFITSSAAKRQGDGANSNFLRADDLEALRQYKRAKQHVDRRASKGRKIRYIVHPKLQNFMYPIPAPSAELNADILFQSLFQ